MKHANILLGVVAGVSLIVIGVASYLLLTTSGTVPTSTNVSQDALNQTGIPDAPNITSKSSLQATSNYLNTLDIDNAYNSDTAQLNTEATPL